MLEDEGPFRNIFLGILWDYAAIGQVQSSRKNIAISSFSLRLDILADIKPSWFLALIMTI